MNWIILRNICVQTIKTNNIGELLFLRQERPMIYHSVINEIEWYQGVGRPNGKPILSRLEGLGICVKIIIFTVLQERLKISTSEYRFYHNVLDLQRFAILRDLHVFIFYMYIHLPNVAIIKYETNVRQGLQMFKWSYLYAYVIQNKWIILSYCGVMILFCSYHSNFCR